MITFFIQSLARLRRDPVLSEKTHEIKIGSSQNWNGFERWSTIWKRRATKVYSEGGDLNLNQVQSMSLCCAVVVILVSAVAFVPNTLLMLVIIVQYVCAKHRHYFLIIGLANDTMGGQGSGLRRSQCSETHGKRHGIRKCRKLTKSGIKTRSTNWEHWKHDLLIKFHALLWKLSCPLNFDLEKSCICFQMICSSVLQVQTILNPLWVGGAFRIKEIALFVGFKQTMVQGLVQEMISKLFETLDPLWNWITPPLTPFEIGLYRAWQAAFCKGYCYT